MKRKIKSVEAHIDFRKKAKKEIVQHRGASLDGRGDHVYLLLFSACCWVRHFFQV